MARSSSKFVSLMGSPNLDVGVAVDVASIVPAPYYL
jgi:hypothetical protein